MRRAAYTLSLWTTLAVPAALAVSDDFNDNALGSAWSRVVDNAAQLDVAEQNGRLELLASNSTNPTNDALYLSNGSAGFTLSTASDFEIAIDYSFSAFTGVGGSGSSLALVFGVGRDLDGTDSAAIGYGPVNLGFATTTALGVASRIDDVQTSTPLNVGGPASGTFVISYDASADDLTLSVGSLAFTLADTVQAVWGASNLFVSLGGRGSGFNTASGNAHLDNFNIRSGTVVPIPEPTAGLVLMTLGTLVMRRR